MSLLGNLDWLAVWKVVSIISAGGFGVLGLISEYKDSVTKKLTTAGIVSLVGIVLSTGFGAIAQAVETSSGAKAALARDQALALQLSATQRAVSDIHRVLSPIGNPELRFVYHRVPCAALGLERACQQAFEGRRRVPGSDSKIGPRELRVPLQSAALSVSINGKGQTNAINGASDLSLFRSLDDCLPGLVRRECDQRRGSVFVYTQDGKNANVTAEAMLEPAQRRPGRMVSTDDLVGGTLTVSLFVNDWVSDRPPGMQLRSPGSICYRAPPSAFRVFQDGRIERHQVRFPDDSMASPYCA